MMPRQRVRETPTLPVRPYPEVRQVVVGAARMVGKR
jgi:hypothetical protein